MNWFKKLFAASPHECLLPPIAPQIYVPMPKVKQNKDISEPVYSFIECVRNNPKRFVESSDYSKIDINIKNYRIKDNQTKESWEISIYRTYSEEFSYVMDKPSFISNNEAMYLVEQIRSIYQNKLKRKNYVLQKRKERLTKKERQRLMEIYK